MSIKVNIEVFVNDYCDGVPDREMLARHGITAKDLISVVKKLIQEGLITKEEYFGRNRKIREREARQEQDFLKSLHHCPVCSHIQPTPFKQCPACGYEFSEPARLTDVASPGAVAQTRDAVSVETVPVAEGDRSAEVVSVVPMEVLPQMAVEVPQSLQSMIGTRLESVSLLDSASGELVSHEFETDEIITGGPESAMFKARASVSGAPVIAVKLFDPELIPREQLEKVTKRIIAIQAAMEDVNILKILGSATVGGNPAIVYEYIPNTLETLVQREPEGVSLELLINVLAQMLNAIGYSHMHRGTDGEIRRLPHMNLKLSRFFFHEETGKVKLEGSAVWRSVVEIWGHKKHLWEEPGVDLSALSPEAFVLDSRSVNPFSADIYALGVAIYRLATGEAPFGGSNVEEYSFAHLRKFPIPPKVHRYTIPSWLDAMILRCLEKEPEKRWRSATQMELQIGKDFSQLGAAGKR